MRETNKPRRKKFLIRLQFQKVKIKKVKKMPSMSKENLKNSAMSTKGIRYQDTSWLTVHMF